MSELGGQAEESPALRLRRSFVYHLHPLKVTERALRFTTTFGLGLATLVLFLALLVTGVLLTAYYVPSVEQARASVLDLQHVVRFGAFVRALHRWAAHGMVAAIFLHLLRVFFTGAWARRNLNWLIGLLLLALTLGLAFTGYLLPWDQLSYWAVRVATGLFDQIPLLGSVLRRLAVGGSEIGQAALIRFYALHVALLPLASVALVALHLWRLRKDGGLARPDEDAPTVNAWPHLIQREAIWMLLVLAAFGLLAALVDAPLGPAPDFHSPSNPEKAPWYFLGLQELVSYSGPMGGFVFPLVLLAMLLTAPRLDDRQAPGGVWLAGSGARFRVGGALAIAILGLAGIELTHIMMRGQGGFGGVLAEIFNPVGAMLLLAGVLGVGTGVLSRSRRAGLSAGIGTLLIGLVLATTLGACRGPGWGLYWPWEVWPVVP